MAKIINLKDPVTNETQYPITKLNCVYDNDGKNMGDVMVTYDLSKDYEPEINELLEKIYPIGSIYISTNGISPAEFLGGTWLPIEDRFLLGKGSSYALGNKGGEATHTLTVDEMPNHNHSMNVWAKKNQTADGTYHAPLDYNANSWWTQNQTTYIHIDAKGGSQPHNNMPPYLVVAMYERIG